MALIRLGGGIVEIRGKYNGGICRKDHTGQHWQCTPVRSKRISTTQKIRRAAFRRLITNYIWPNASLTFIAEWTIFARPPQNWFQKFISYNLNRYINGEDVVIHPPDVYAPYRP